MKYLFAILFVGGFVCVINFWVLNFLKSKFQGNRDTSGQEGGIDYIKEDLDKDVEELHSLIESSLEEVKAERLKIEEERRNFQALMEEGKACIEELKQLKEEMPEEPLQPKSESGEVESAKRLCRDKSYNTLYSLLKQGLSIEDIAQSMNMGMGELKLRLAVLKNEDMWDES
ncbi:MAG: hypothetical protein GF375_04295 [Candidatus Omnitrophica bacterium]|nr:hypothetical protein [Candidatus Omnitrophota bacterium]MBD3269265.1 hypothetical protein [Candidatus Omnitrophota bacterium]